MTMPPAGPVPHPSGPQQFPGQGPGPEVPIDDSVKVFLSHSSADRKKADNVYAAFTAAGIPTFYSPHAIGVGGQYQHEIMQAIDECQVMVVLLSPTRSPPSTCCGRPPRRRPQQDAAAVLLGSIKSEKDIPAEWGYLLTTIQMVPLPSPGDVVATAQQYLTNGPHRRLTPVVPPQNHQYGAAIRDLAGVSGSLAADFAQSSSEGLGRLKSKLEKVKAQRSKQRGWDLLNRAAGMVAQAPAQAANMCQEALNTFASLAADDPTDGASRAGMADALTALGDLTPDPRARFAMRQDIVTILNEALHTNPGDDQLQFRLGNGLDKLAPLVAPESPGEALSLQQRALAVWQGLVNRSNDPNARRRLSSALVKVANHVAAHDPATARQMLTDCLNLRLVLRQEAPHDPARNADVTAAAGYLVAFADAVEGQAAAERDTEKADALRSEATKARRAVTAAQQPPRQGPPSGPAMRHGQVPPGPMQSGQHRR